MASERDLHVATDQGWIDELAVLEAESARHALLDSRPELHRPEAVELLAEEVRRRLRIDLRQAERLAAAAVRLAEVTGTDRSHGLALKAEAQVSHFAGRYEQALESFHGSLERFRAAGDEMSTAAVLSSSLQTLILLGRYDEAFATADEAAEILRRHDDRLRLARLDSNVGNIYHRQDRFAEALRLYRRSLEEFRRSGGEPQDVAVALSNIAVCQIAINEFDGAEATYRELSQVCRRHDLPLLAAQADYNIAYLHFQRGDYTRALEQYEVSRAACLEAGDPYHSALCDLDQGEIYLELNLTSEGERLAGSALKAFEELGMAQEAARSLALLAVAAHQQRNSFRALRLFSEARERFEAEGNLLWPAMIDLYRALILFDEGRFFEARSLADAASRFFHRSEQAGRASLCDLLMARVLLKTGERDAARQRCEMALSRLESLDLPVLGYRAYFVLGQIEEADGRISEASAAYLEAHDRLESLRTHLRGEELKIAFLRDKLEVYESVVYLALAGMPSDEDQRSAFSYIEEAKSRGLADLIAFRAHALPPSSGAHSGLVEEMRQLRSRLNWFYRQIDLRELQATAGVESGELRAPHEPAAAAGAGDAAVEELRRRSRESETELLKSLSELRARDAEYGSLQAAGSVGLEEIRAALPEDATILEYYEARGVVFAAVLDRDRLRVTPVTTGDKVRESLRYLHFQLSKFRLDPGYLEALKSRLESDTRSHLHELYLELVEPILGLLDTEHLAVVPHGALHHLPFHALHDGESHLLDRFPISYAPSASVFQMCCARPPSRNESSLILGVPDDLAPGIVGEVEAVAAALPGARLYMGAEATDERLRALGPESRIVHIATHGFFRQDNPMFSAIQLGNSRLTLFDLYQLRLGSDLVVLSGCGTGLNVVESGDELIGLTRGLLYAGSQSVLATLWDVHDESTSQFMTAFYRALPGLSNRAEAVRQAMLELRQAYPHPYYWAPFILVGNPFAA